METKQFILTVIQILVSAGTILIAFWLGYMSTNTNHKINTARTRFENFYLLYLQMYYRGMMWEIRFSELSIKARGDFLDLIMDNFHYASFNVQNMIPDFYTTWFELLDEQNGRKYNPPRNIHIDTLFYRLTQTVFSEYESLCKELKLPLPAMPLLPNDSYIKTNR